MTEHDTITIKNGKELRKWIAFGGSILLTIIVGVTAWVSLQKQVEENSATLNRACKEVDKRFIELGTAGSLLAHQNQRDIIAMKKDIEYTAVTVSKIADRVGVVQ